LGLLNDCADPAFPWNSKKAVNLIGAVCRWREVGSLKLFSILFLFSRFSAWRRADAINQLKCPPKGKNKDRHVEVSGRRHAESAVERMDAVANPECNSRYDKHEGSRGNRLHCQFFGFKSSSSDFRLDEFWLAALPPSRVE
jgi:hypothetical protein